MKYLSYQHQYPNWHNLLTLGCCHLQLHHKHQPPTFHPYGHVIELVHQLQYLLFHLQHNPKMNQKLQISENSNLHFLKHLNCDFFTKKVLQRYHYHNPVHEWRCCIPKIELETNQNALWFLQEIFYKKNQNSHLFIARIITHLAY